jgi:putative FmdB family regulatory protein
MPTYNYKCECGNIIEADFLIEDYQPSIKCHCGKMAKRIFTPPMLGVWEKPDYRQMNPENTKREMEAAGMFE